MADLKLKATMTRRTLLQAAPLVAPAAALGREIGRASCRERV